MDAGRVLKFRPPRGGGGGEEVEPLMLAYPMSPYPAQMPYYNNTPSSFPPQIQNSSQINMLWALSCTGILIWLVLITILFPLLYVNLHNQISSTTTNFTLDQQELDNDLNVFNATAEELQSAVSNASTCIDQLCASSVYPGLLENVIVRGCWDASTNTPTLNDSNGDPGDLYVVCVAGSATTLNNVSSWAKDDLIKRVADYIPNMGVDTWVTLPYEGVTVSDAHSGTGESLIDVGVGNPIQLVQFNATGDVTLVDQGDYVDIVVNASTPGAQVIPYTSMGLVDTTPTAVNATNVSVIEQMWTQVGDDLHVTFTILIPYVPPFNATDSGHTLPIDGFFSLIVPILPDFPHNPWCGAHRTMVSPTTTPDGVQIKIWGSEFDTIPNPDELVLRWRIDYVILPASEDHYYLKFYCVWNDHSPPADLP